METSDQQPEKPPASSETHHTKRGIVLIVAIFVLGVLIIIAATWLMTSNKLAKTSSTAKTQPTATQDTVGTSGVQAVSLQSLQPDKKYGDKYANGLLPVGDGKYVTDGAKKGYIYSCNANFVPASQAGAQTRGPWFTNNNTQWDMNKKARIAGDVSWKQNITMNVASGTRTITTNDLPDHHTGVFTVAASDPAKVYDANPNTIKTQTLTYGLAAAPTAGQPQCMGGEVGIMLTGVALFSAFDAGGRDAGAWEVQDNCDGHPQSAGEYHYHTLSRCIKDVSVNTVIGFALDGFPITGPKVSDGNILTTDDLDECHGLSGEVTLDGKKTTTYHYVMTQDFPYSASCFRAKAIQPPGQHENTGSQGGPQQGSGPTSSGQNQQGPPPPPGMPAPGQTPGAQPR